MKYSGDRLSISALTEQRKRAEKGTSANQSRAIATRAQFLRRRKQGIVVD